MPIRWALELRQGSAVREDRVTELFARIHDDVSGIQQSCFGNM